MDFIAPDWIGVPDNIGAISTVRHGGVSRAPYDDGMGGGGLNLGTHVGDSPDHVRQNRSLLRSILPSEPRWMTQVHGTTVLDAAEVSDVPQADACIATLPGVVCVIQTADCLPVLFCDAGGRVVGAAHAGWRGLAGGVLENTVARMHDAGAGKIVAWMGAAIGPECFEVGEDVLAAFARRDAENLQAFKPIAGQAGKYLADIYALARMTLNKTGITRVHGGEFCTVTDKRRFYSYRRDRTTGRMASLIWLK